MPNRIVREGLIDSRAFNSLSDSAQMFYGRLILIVDDYGRYESDPELLRAKLFGRILERWPLDRVSQALADVGACLTDDGQPLVTIYSFGNSSKKYLQVNNFRQRQRAEKSKYPDPVSRLSDKGPSDDGQPRASRARSSTTTTTTTTTPLGGVGGCDEQFAEYARLMMEHGRAIPEDFLPGTFTHRAWYGKDFEQKTQIIDSIKARIAAGEKILHKPDSYITSNEHKRPIRAPTPISNRPLTREERIDQAIRDA